MSRPYVGLLSWVSPQPKGCGPHKSDCEFTPCPLGLPNVSTQHRAPLKTRCMSCTATRASRGKCRALPSGHTDAALLSLARSHSHRSGLPRKGQAWKRHSTQTTTPILAGALPRSLVRGCQERASQEQGRGHLGQEQDTEQAGSTWEGESGEGLTQAGLSREKSGGRGRLGPGAGRCRRGTQL